MIKLTKLCFICCLIFRATLVEGVITEGIAYETLKNLDVKFWEEEIFPHYKKQLARWQNTVDFLFEPSCSIAQAVFEYLDPFYKYGIPQILFEAPTYIDFSGKPVLNFSEASMLDIISVLYEVLQCKVISRDGKDYQTKAKGDIWNIKYKKDGYALDRKGDIIDPYFTEVNITEKTYHLHLNYSGQSPQPGNSCLRQLSKERREAQPWANGEKYNSRLNDKEHYVLQNFLFCLEVARRRVVDPNRGNGVSVVNGVFRDKYCNLPILGAIVIGLELMNSREITRDDFFAGAYRCFSDKGNDDQSRGKNIGKLLLKFCEKRNIQTSDEFKKYVEKLYRNFIKQKVTDRVLSSKELSDFVNDNVLKKLKAKGFTCWEPIKNLTKEVLDTTNFSENSTPENAINSLKSKNFSELKFEPSDYENTLQEIQKWFNPVYVLDVNGNGAFVRFLGTKKTKYGEKQKEVKNLNKTYFSNGFVFLHSTGKDDITRWFYLNKSNGTMYLLSEK